jgi:hypothetical protein
VRSWFRAGARDLTTPGRQLAYAERALQDEHGSPVSEIRDRDIQDETGQAGQVQAAVQPQLCPGRQADVECLPGSAGHDIRIIGHLCLGFRRAAALSRPPARNHARRTCSL